MRIGVLGAGISGLSIAKLLSPYYDVEVLEKNSFVGGIARTKNIEGIAYHPVGGHCFNSKHQEVLDFVFNQVLPKENWHSVKRKAVIRFKNQIIPYPIEYAVKEVFKFDKVLAINIVKDFLATTENPYAKNLEEWFKEKFGNTLSEHYFIPYNRKIWGIHPKEMSFEWVKDKLPIPNKDSFTRNLFEEQSDTMAHYTFFYPKDNYQNSFIKALAKDLNITLNYSVNTINKQEQSSKWTINNDREYDLIINTLPLNIVPTLVNHCPESILSVAKKLKYNKVTTMFWESVPNHNTWTYIPDEDSIFHRYIHIGNFNNPNKNYTITEAIGEKTFEEMEACGKKDSSLIKPLDYNVSDHAYVVFDENYESSKLAVKNYLEEIGILTLGRFGEWEYYNMDICIKKSLEMCELIKEKY